MDNKSAEEYVGTYIDLFSGCGGFSLGLGRAGWKGLFAVEKDPMAFSTFQHNMVKVGSKYGHFDWVDWLPQEATTIQKLIENHHDNLLGLRGRVDLIAGGPPCQGFSMAGMRNSNDPRNKMSQEYIKMVGLIRPKYLLLENVRGFNSAFKKKSDGSDSIPYAKIVQESIEREGYKVFKDYIHSERFGVPQTRTRFIMVGIRDDVFSENNQSPFVILEDIRRKFLQDKGLTLSPVTVKEAISDLETSSASLINHSGPSENSFKKLDYKVPEKLSPYQALMRIGLDKQKPNSLRLARHRKTTINKFKLIQTICRPGIVLSDKEKAIIGTKKQTITVLDPHKPSKTITTLPDDILHYSEPRILTVRENARIQSFPDDFDFTGRYTTGGERRKKECPRYTQVGNAVPPLLGEALGVLIRNIKCNLK